MSNRPPVIRKLVVIGSLFLFAGAGMTLRGVVHTLSGEPIEGNRYEKPSSGPVDLLFGLIGMGLGGFIIRRGLQGRPWP